jgi:hypothetical protein
LELPIPARRALRWCISACGLGGYLIVASRFALEVQIYRVKQTFLNGRHERDVFN